ncbi:pirin family protein [Skermania piniformis]|uniref:Pirin family protein n=1 Tax=Skermania pinensis TaxID=39122 RepID=A0ABX8S8Z1_9ACTN|nr:pirin family protein [Skermania piniformis]QXQ13746.1 pirin family protein [Skermania piniformis]
MPAVTVDDRTTLPVLSVPGANPRPRPVREVTTAPRGFEGEGFPVHRAFAGVPMHLLDPFIHMDQMGEVDYGAGEPKGTPWHPHRGFETVTYMIDGIMEHQDSNGGGGSIGGGDTQWMTAGGGILHIEAPPEQLVATGGLFHGVQLWVNLPRSHKLIAPRYQDIGAGRVSLLTSPDGGALIRVIAGEVGAYAGPGATHTPVVLLHITISPGAQVVLPWNPEFNALAYGLAGRGTVGAEQRPIRDGRLAVFDGGHTGDTLVLQAADTQDSRTAAFEVFVMGGKPIREPIAMAGPFVMNTKAEVEQAFRDYEAGRLGVLPAAHG